MTSKDLIQQYVDTGIKISEYQFNQLNNNLRITYLRKRLMVGKLVDYEILMLPDDIRTKYINNLDLNGIGNLLKDSKEPDKIINILLSTEGFINKLDSNGIHYLLIFSKEPEKIINLLGNKGIEYINNLDSNKTNHLLRYSKEKEKIKELIRKRRPDFN